MFWGLFNKKQKNQAGQEELRNLLKSNKISNSSYGMSAKDLKQIQDVIQQFGLSDKRFPDDKLMFEKGKLIKTDGNDTDKLILGHIKTHEKHIAKGDLKKAVQNKHLLSRGMSLMDLSGQLYELLNENPNSISYWFPLLEKMIDKQDFFKVPNTKILRLPIELAQYLRVEWQETSKASRDAFNQLIFDKFNLEDGKTYFIKTGTFSQKFQFANCKCSEPREMGDYFSVINNEAMILGAAHSNDLCVREYIEDVEGNPTIYNGMPLHTEYRAFVNMETGELYGIVPYWNPVVMKNTFRASHADDIQADLKTYESHEAVLMERYNANVSLVAKKIKELVKHNKNFVGQWSIDVMQNGEDFYIIDMHQAQDSALYDLLDKEKIEKMKADMPDAWDWTKHLFQNGFYLDRLKEVDKQNADRQLEK